MTGRASLEARATIGLAELLVVLAASIFLSSWSLRYWQGWTFLAVFSTAVTLITVYFLRRDPALIERRLKAGPAAETERSQQIIQALAGVSFIALFVLSAIDHRFHWSRVPTSVVLLGDVLVVLGLLIVFLVFRENSYTSATIEVESEQSVISTGPYRRIRHPMYSGALLLLCGVPPALGSLWGLVVCAPLTAVIVWRLIEEERYLSTNLSGYTEYRASTPYRLIPWLY